MTKPDPMPKAAVRIAPELFEQAPSVTGVAGGIALSEHERVAYLFDTYYDFVWRLVRRLGTAPAMVDDATQRVFIVAARKVAEIEPNREQSFLHGVAIRVVADMRDAARRRGTPEELDERAPAPDPGADELLDQKRARQWLDQILQSMELAERSVFVLFELEGLTMAEIASVEGLAPGTVASRLKRARETFAAKTARLRARRMP
jgi:RNA polymerase sigma-70 factor, ECF subfamily